MKTIALTIMCSMLSMYTLGNIKNGFEKDVIKAEKAKSALKSLIDASTESDASLGMLCLQYTLVKIKSTDLRKLFQHTEALINDLRTVHPDLFNEINSIKDYHGNRTDVYVRVLPEDQMNVLHWGTTNLEQTNGDVHTYQSRYGSQAVSVVIRLCGRMKSLHLLVHELGHVKYQVPNLASYVEYFREAYKYTRENQAFGHKDEDPSNLSSIYELERFNMVFRARKHLLISSKKQKQRLSKGEYFVKDIAGVDPSD